MIGPDRIRLEGRRMEHVTEVQRAKVGDRLRVGVMNGRIGVGRITALTAVSVEMALELTTEPPPPLPVTLVLALPRPKVFRRVLRAISAMGVKRVCLINAFRVERSYWQSPMLAEAAIQEQLVLGLEQACDTMLPELAIRKGFKPFVEDELPAISAGTLCLLGHPPAEPECPRNVGKSVTLAIGPEGGFIDYEVGKLEAIGFTAVSLGRRVLSVETAVPALLGRLF